MVSWIRAGVKPIHLRRGGKDWGGGVEMGRWHEWLPGSRFQPQPRCSVVMESGPLDMRSGREYDTIADINEYTIYNFTGSLSHSTIIYI